MRCAKLKDYLIDPSGADWATILSEWCPPLPRSLTPWLVNRFGDLFAVLDDGSVHLLDPNCGTLSRIANDRSDLADRIDIGDNANDWLMIPLVDRCVEAGIVLAEHQCYGFKIPTFLGGTYEIENVAPFNLAEYYSFMADLHRQIKDLPDGTKVRLVVLPERDTSQ